MTKPAITISELDAERLDALLEQPVFASTEVARALVVELKRAEILPSEKIPADVVTMNSKVHFRDVNNQEEYIRTLVYPASLQDSSQQISVMAPLGAALLGMHVNNEITWELPGGNETRIKVLKLLYQPEAAGEYYR